MARMRRAAALGIMLLALVVARIGQASAADSSPPLVLERQIALPNVGGRIDHMAVDLRRNRLFVAELGNGTVDAVDLTTGKPLHRIDGLPEPQGLGYAVQADVLAVASAGDGSVRLFRGEDLSLAGTVALGDDADNVRIDPTTGNLVVGYGSGGLATIDPRSGTVLSRARLPAHPEGFQLNPRSRRAFVNVPDANQVAVVDLAGGAQVASWRVPGFRGNFPMAFDAAGALVATVFRGPPRVVLLDANTGAPVGSFATCGDADDVFFDSKRQRMYVSCGDGAVDVLQRGTTGYGRVATVKTASGARTALFVPELDRLFVAARAGFLGLAADAAILEFRPQ